MSDQEQQINVDHHRQQEEQHKPTVGEKISGTVESLIGKVTKNEDKVVEGQAKKTGNEPTNANFNANTDAHPHSQSQSHDATSHSHSHSHCNGNETNQSNQHHLGSGADPTTTAPLAPIPASGEGNTNATDIRAIASNTHHTNNNDTTPYHTPTNVGVGGEGELGPGPITSTGVNVITPSHPSHPVHGDSAPLGGAAVPGSQVHNHGIEQQRQDRDQDLRYPSTAGQGGVGSTGYQAYGGLPTGSGPAGNTDLTGQGDLGASGHHNHHHEQGGTAAGTGFQA